MKLLKEKANYSFNKMKTWQDNKIGDYNDERFRETISQLFQSQYLKPSNAPDEQIRRNSGHTKVLRDVPTQSRIHPTYGRPLVKPQDMNIWEYNGKKHSFGVLHDYNAGYVPFV